MILLAELACLDRRVLGVAKEATYGSKKGFGLLDFVVPPALVRGILAPAAPRTLPVSREATEAFCFLSYSRPWRRNITTLGTTAVGRAKVPPT